MLNLEVNNFTSKIIIQYSIFDIQSSSPRQVLRDTPVFDGFGPQPPARYPFDHAPDLKHLVHIKLGVDAHLVHHHHHILCRYKAGDVGIFLVIAPCSAYGDPAYEVCRLSANASHG